MFFCIAPGLCLCCESIVLQTDRLAVFGSCASGHQTPDSDVDIMVEFREPVGLLFVHLADYLEDILDAKVDLVTPDGIKPNRWPYIREELTYV